MYNNSKTIFIQLQTPMHVGTGSDLGHVDLPIQREKHTSYPIIQASSLKGALRNLFENKSANIIDDINTQLLFGYDGRDLRGVDFFSDKESRDYAGALAFSDARILFFPVKSYKGVFALITCPYVLKRFAKDTGLIDEKDVDNLKSNLSSEDCVIPLNGEGLTVGQNHIILEEYKFDIFREDSSGSFLRLKESLTDLGLLGEKVIIVNDNVFADFCNMSTEIITRIKINNRTGTVDEKALFTEELLPAATWMYSLLAARKVFLANPDSSSFLDKKIIHKDLDKLNDSLEVIDLAVGKIQGIGQIGGDQNLGRGIVEFTYK